MVYHTLGKETVIRHVPHFHPQCEEAEINFFVESINSALFQYAAKNVWIPHPEWTQKAWEPYGKMVDEIWVKTREAEALFLKLTPNVKYVSWTSIDKTYPELGSKDRTKGIVPVGKNVCATPSPFFRHILAFCFRTRPHLRLSLT